MGTTRRAPGAGHLFVRRDAAGRESWYGKWRVDGQQMKRRLGPKRRPNGHGLNRREAERKLREVMEQVAPPPASRVTVREAGERLVAHLEALGRKRATIEAYESLLRVHLAPFFAGRSLDAIRPEDVEAFIAAERQGGSSAKTVHNAVGFLFSIYEFAQRKRMARRNPCKLVDRPRDASGSDIRFLDAEELEAVVRAERERGDELSPTLSLMYLTAAMTGLRQGELIGLRWRDLDWPASRVRVRQSFVRGEFTSPKSRRGVRSVPLADELAGELERHFRESVFQTDDDLVFAHPATGRPLDRSKIRKRFKVAVKRAGVREVRFHDLRHSFGTRMAGVGVPMRTLQEWLGHRDFATTLIYADYSPSEQEREWVAAAFARGDLVPPVVPRAGMPKVPNDGETSI
jgi:integrase